MQLHEGGVAIEGVRSLPARSRRHARGHGDLGKSLEEDVGLSHAYHDN